VLRRLEAMGVRARLMKGGRCVLASLRLGAEPFPTPGGRVRIGNVVFATVGADRIKCLRPRALFQLPMLRILDCRDATAIEARIRLAWQTHVERLDQTRRWLERLGAEATAAEEQSLWVLPLAGERPGVQVSLVEPRRVILPGAGPLSGVALSRAEDRVLAVDAALDSGADLELAIANRIDELRRMEHRLTETRRRAALRSAQPAAPARPAPGRSHRPLLFLVGPRMAEDRACAESLRLRGYRVEVARSQQAALALLDDLSPELVLVDARLGRSEGIEMIPALRSVPGVEEIPLVLVDDHRRAARREAARRAGAAGYLVRPVDVARIARRLERMIGEPRRRRYTRYRHKLPVRLEGSDAPSLATAVGRGGMFLATDEDLPTRSVHRCEVTLPELGRAVRAEGEVLYRAVASGDGRRGLGVRFQRFAEGNEALLIRYLRSLDGSAPRAAGS